MVYKLDLCLGAAPSYNFHLSLLHTGRYLLLQYRLAIPALGTAPVLRAEF